MGQRRLDDHVDRVTGPILFTDHTTGRTFVSQLSADCSLMAFTDNDGASWFQNPVGEACDVLCNTALRSGALHVGSDQEQLSVETEHDPADSLLVLIVGQSPSTAATGEQEGAGGGAR